MHRMLIKKVVENGKPEDMKYLEDIMIEMIDDIKVYDYEEYKDIEYKLYKLVYGEHLNEELAHKWVSKMQNKDGTVGEHWSIEQTSQYAGNHNKYDWYACMNSIWSDYYNAKFTTDDYIKLSNDFINDPDALDSKILNYYFYIVKK